MCIKIILAVQDYTKATETDYSKISKLPPSRILEYNEDVRYIPNEEGNLTPPSVKMVSNFA